MKTILFIVLIGIPGFLGSLDHLSFRIRRADPDAEDDLEGSGDPSPGGPTLVDEERPEDVGGALLSTTVQPITTIQDSPPRPVEVEVPPLPVEPTAAEIPTGPEETPPSTPIEPPTDPVVVEKAPLPPDPIETQETPIPAKPAEAEDPISKPAEVEQPAFLAPIEGEQPLPSVATVETETSLSAPQLVEAKESSPPTPPTGEEEPLAPTKPIAGEEPLAPSKPLEEPLTPSKPLDEPLAPSKPLEEPKAPSKPLEEEEPLALSKPLEAEEPLAPSKPLVEKDQFAPLKPLEAQEPLEEKEPLAPSKPLDVLEPLAAPNPLGADRETPTTPIEGAEVPLFLAKPVETVQPSPPLEKPLEQKLPTADPSDLNKAQSISPPSAVFSDNASVVATPKKKPSRPRPPQSAKKFGSPIPNVYSDEGDSDESTVAQTTSDSDIVFEGDPGNPENTRGFFPAPITGKSGTPGSGPGDVNTFSNGPPPALRTEPIEPPSDVRNKVDDNGSTEPWPGTLLPIDEISLLIFILLCLILIVIILVCCFIIQHMKSWAIVKIDPTIAPSNTTYKNVCPVKTDPGAADVPTGVVIYRTDDIRNEGCVELLSVSKVPPRTRPPPPHPPQAKMTSFSSYSLEQKPLPQTIHRSTAEVILSGATQSPKNGVKLYPVLESRPLSSTSRDTWFHDVLTRIEHQSADEPDSPDVMIVDPISLTKTKPIMSSRPLTNGHIPSDGDRSSKTFLEKFAVNKKGFAPEVEVKGPVNLAVPGSNALSRSTDEISVDDLDDYLENKSF